MQSMQKFELDRTGTLDIFIHVAAWRTWKIHFCPVLNVQNFHPRCILSLSALDL